MSINLSKSILILLPFICWSADSQGQCPTSDFNIPASICTNEQIEITNLTLAASEYEWDFCEGDFNTTPTAFSLPTLLNSSTPRGIDVISDGGNWHGFVTSRANHSLIRVDFGNDLNNANPSYTNLGNISGLLNGPEPIRILNEAGNWFAIIHNGANQTLVRVDFGSIISNPTPTAEVIVSGIGTLNSSLDIGKSQGSLVAIISKSSNNLDIVNFGTSITNIPQVSDIINTATLTGLLGGLIDLKLVNQCDQWVGLAVSFSSKRFYVLEFGNDLFSTPSITQLGSNSVFGSDNPYRVDVAYDNNAFIALITTQSGNLHKVNLGNDLSNIDTGLTSDNLGDFGLLNLNFSLDLVKDQSAWYAFTLDNTSRDLFKIIFNNECLANIISSNDVDISSLSYAGAGIYNIGLVSLDNDGNVDRITKSIAVASDTAPDIASTSQNICLSNPIDFTSTNTSADITTYLWDFGDANTSPDANPSHTYAAAGEYEVTLDVISSNGCNNFTKQMIKIYDEPVPSFTLPSGTICTSEDYTFVNNTVDNFDGNLTYEWQVGGVMVGTDRDLIYQFATQGAKEIKLITSISGCSIEQVQNIPTVNLGATPFYTYDTNNACLEDSIIFTNESTGAGITSYSWDFGDTNTSMDTSPSHAYILAGTYMVSLAVTNTAGCITSYQQEVIVHSMPVTDFSSELACTDRTTEFTDLTTVDNANITIWDWDFGDASSGSDNTSSDEDPLHTFSDIGDFTVTLSSTSNFGCESSTQKIITVLESPTIEFEVESKCVGEPFQFSDISVPNSGGSIISRAWNIDGSVYTVQNPSHTFADAGTYTATLTIRSDNLCTVSTTQMIVVDGLPTVDFSLSSNCVNTAVSLQDESILENDNIVDWQWTVNGENIGTGSQIIYTFDEATTQQVELRIITERGCIVSQSKNIEFFDLPTADFDPTPQYSAPPAEITFDNLSSNAASYLWNFGDGSLESTQESPSHTYTGLGTYDVSLIVTSSEGCTDEIIKQVHLINPKIDLAIGEITTFNNGESLLFTMSNKGTVPISDIIATISLNNEVFIKESFDLRILPNQTAVPKTLSFTIPDNGNIEFLCISISTPDGDDINTKDNTQCINLDSDFEIFHPYPSPVSREELITIPIIGTKNDEVTIALMSASGKQFFSKFITLTQTGLNNIELSLFSLKPGIYFIQVQSAKTTKSFRIFVN